jgi:Restriction endonuclease
MKRTEREVARQQQERTQNLEEREGAFRAREQAFEALVGKTIEGFDFIADAWADYEEARAERAALELEQKSHPAPIAAEAIRTKGAELAEALRRAKAAEWIVELYEWQLPSITELRESTELESFVKRDDDEDERKDEDPVATWLTREEYQALSTVERNQRSLDRYLKSRKTPWQLGRDYERYIGYLREQRGCKVTYHGIFKGLEDLGRDVLAEKDGHLEVIQCKRWAQEKTIHEKHIFQLYGTVVLAALENPDRGVTGTFTTTTRLSAKAREVADYLGIKVEEGVPLANYPRIKCNVARAGASPGERIYHLPFDQQYDTTVIEPERGECYVHTVVEAEELGFRRAWRWRPEPSIPDDA